MRNHLHRSDQGDRGAEGPEAVGLEATDSEIAEWAKALAHPARLQILRTLAKRNTCLCGEIVEVLPLAQSTVSQHLKVLREAGLVAGESDGPRSCYCLDPGGLRRARAGFDQLLSGLDCATGCGC